MMGSPERPPDRSSPQQLPRPVLSEDIQPATQQPFETNVKDDVTTPVATETPSTPQQAANYEPAIPAAVTRRLYLSHFLSTWNSRSFEFGAVLFLASAFPLTLLPLSIYALVRSASAIVFAPVIGRVIDRRGRLPVVRFSIGLQSTFVPHRVKLILGRTLKPKMCDGFQDLMDGTALNARMRRIDLFCKLAGPLFIALIDGASTKAAIFVTLGMNVLSVPIEYLAIAQVYNSVPLLKGPKNAPSTIPETEAFDRSPIESSRCDLRWVCALFEILRFYYQHQAFLPSFALSLLYLTVLSFSGQMVTYLISVGYNSFHIALVRTLSVIFELSATWIAPRAMERINPARAGMWFLSWQVLSLGAAVCFFWVEPVAIVAASGLVAGTILSRIGLWGYDLCAQFIIQEVSETSRCVSCFEVV
ncbi:MAG: hypothetical protein Q9225_005219 [Loekoesia sp. 1 TL-2023]